MKFSVNSGASIATAAATLFIAGAVVAPIAQAAATGHCFGANACKGQSACKSASNACKGQNACKGLGFKEITAAKCQKIAGTRFVPANHKG
jgi:uncharacterized membrane protein